VGGDFGTGKVRICVSFIRRGAPSKLRYAPCSVLNLLFSSVIYNLILQSEILAKMATTNNFLTTQLQHGDSENSMNTPQIPFETDPYEVESKSPANSVSVGT
jgi:hypothetical protein